MELLDDVEIEIQSEISDEFAVFLIFGRQYPVPITLQTFRMVWKLFVLPSNGKVNFIFPRESKIGAFCYEAETLVTAEPLDAEIGSKWIATTGQGSLTLAKDCESIHVPTEGYMVHNKDQSENTFWKGYVIYAALYKEESERPIVSKKCRVGNVVALKPVTKLYICAMIPSYSAICNEFRGYIQGTEKVSQKPADIAEVMELLPDCEFTPMFELDLLQYCSHGKIIINVQEEQGGKIVFLPSLASN